MRHENKRMQQFLRDHGIKATPKYIRSGSLKGAWRLYNKRTTWTQEIQDRLDDLGFLGFDGQPLHRFSGNGGSFCVFVRGHYELLEEGGYKIGAP